MPTGEQCESLDATRDTVRHVYNYGLYCLDQIPDGWFECNECGYSVDGDYNAAKNIGLKL